MNAHLVALVNGLWFWLSLGIIGIFGLYVISEWREFGFKRFRMQAAISVLTYFVGSAIFRGAIWVARDCQSESCDPGLIVKHQSILISIGSAISLFGALYIIKVFSPREWGRWPWVTVGCGALALVSIVEYFGMSTQVIVTWVMPIWLGLTVLAFAWCQHRK